MHVQLNCQPQVESTLFVKVYYKIKSHAFKISIVHTELNIQKYIAALNMLYVSRLSITEAFSKNIEHHIRLLTI